MITLDALLKLLQFLLFCVLLSALGFIASYQINRKDQAIVIPRLMVKAGTVEHTIVFPESQPFEKIADKIQDRDIFTRVSSQPDVTTANPTGQLPANIKVVGIIIGKPSQVVLEDSQQKSTQFIVEGQKPINGVNFERIEKGVIYLNYQGQVIPIHIEK